ncbi:POK6 protein, partial [Oceanites oceanicus]|nr:POK6 protein [Oceanites oceanicus]
LSEGNHRADKLVAPMLQIPAGNVFQQACQSHAVFHQSARTLVRHFGLPLADAQGIVKSCPDCQKIGFGLGTEVNPQSTSPLQLWQMDITHIFEFGQKKYVHVSVDTCSCVIWATPQ